MKNRTADTVYRIIRDLPPIPWPLRLIIFWENTERKKSTHSSTFTTVGIEYRNRIDLIRVSRYHIQLDCHSIFSWHTYFEVVYEYATFRYTWYVFFLNAIGRDSPLVRNLLPRQKDYYLKGRFSTGYTNVEFDIFLGGLDLLPVRSTLEGATLVYSLGWPNR